MEASPPTTHNEAQQHQKPAPPPQPAGGPDMRLIVTMLPHTPNQQLAKDCPFAVACVDRLDSDIFVVFHNWITNDFNIFKLPQTYHQQFSIFCHAICEHNVQNVYIENLGTNVDGNPFFRVFGGRFKLVLWWNNASLQLVRQTIVQTFS